MKKNILMLLVFLSFFYSLYSRTPKYELAICTIFRDDAKYLPEWIEFHRKQGVEHFYLYDNLSLDNPKAFLKFYINKGIVTLYKWPYECSNNDDWVPIQCGAYMHCVKKHRSCKWIAFLDTDEFLFCPDKKDLRVFLKDFIQYGSVSAYWRMYGTSNRNIPEDAKLLDCLVYRAKDSNRAHSIFKTIAQPRFVENIVNPHYVILTHGKINLQFEVDKLRINHYWSRDLDFFYNVKLARRDKWYNARETHLKMESEMNEIYDPILANTSG
jgi:hypothetical protein